MEIEIPLDEATVTVACPLKQCMVGCPICNGKGRYTTPVLEGVAYYVIDREDVENIIDGIQGMRP